ncbi:ABC transporter ATP-binding protein [[Pseudopropionibacterium] massiliense]|uniref:ABC transporter ATP-binding protein n=1 Tax=[Pseudopropionibacterium] massiliense TaxID=2220000 RepID=UPI00103139C5|nr:ABC transporter ATP-binding protein [[Pseudopropionibacterium] massiliense]
MSDINRNALLPRYRRLMAPLQWRRMTLGFNIGIVAGALSGFSLLALLPASTALATGAPAWGLGFGGWLAVLLATAVVTLVVDFIGTRTGYLGALGFMQSVHHSIGDKVARLPLAWFTPSSAGSMSRMATQEMFSLTQSVAHFLYKLRVDVAACVVIGIGAWFWDWRLGLLLTCAAPVLTVGLVIGRRLLNHGKAIAEPSEVELAARIVEFSRCQGALRSCHAQTPPGLRDAFDANHRDSRRAFAWEAFGNMVNGAIAQLVVVAMIILSASLALSSQLSPLRAIVTIGMCLRFMTMLSNIGAMVVGFEERRQMMNHIDQVMDSPVLPEPDVSTATPSDGTVELVDVDFGYQPDVPVLRGVSMSVPSGSMCALVGPSGSGKTTIARLIARFYDVDSGQLRIGGVDVKQLTTEDLMSQLSMVFQDVYLFDDTLEANIRLGRPDATDDEVRRAAALAGATEIVERLPDGWETRVGEGGRALSGGERQRVSIARALLKRAPIVLLDEATSALDAENEANIVSAMEELRRSSTLIVIAHKLETIAAADQVVVLGADGHVAQQGRHDDLVGTEGPYRDFWEYRSSASGWSLV